MTDESDKPVPPADNECCESGCSPCVWDLYYEALQRWQAQQAAEAALPESGRGQQ